MVHPCKARLGEALKLSILAGKGVAQMTGVVLRIDMNPAFDPVEWHEFFVMLGGVAAVLAGLQFVVLVFLVENEGPALLRTGPRTNYLNIGAVIAVSAIALIPEQPRVALSVEIALIAVVLLVEYALEVIGLYRRTGRVPQRMQRWGPVRYACQLTLLGGGVSLAVDHGPALYLVGLACVGLVLSFLQSSWWTLQGPHVQGSRPAA